MDIELTSGQKAFARQAINTGRLHSEEEAVVEALALWEVRERTRTELLASLDMADASLANGNGRLLTKESMLELTDEVQRRGRARWAVKQSNRG